MKFDFIHIPKCAGSSVVRALGLKGCMHKRASASTGGFTFAFVRNPFDRLVSSYNYLTGGFGNLGDQEYGNTLSKSFNGFVRNGIDLDWLHFKPMTHWVDTDIEYVGKFENLDSDFSDIAKIIGSDATLGHINKAPHKHFAEYYDDETREIVREAYALDIETFGYALDDFSQ